MKKEIKRKCIATNEVKNRNELFRIVKTPNNEVKVDFTYKLNGRGAYLSKNKDVILLAKKKKLLNRALETDVSDDVYDFLCRLDKDDIDMYIITDGRSVTQRNKIRVLGLDEFIPPSNVYISEDVGADKTENKAFSEILESYKTEWVNDLVQFIFVGDNPQKDFFVGNSYGFPTVMLSNDGYNIHSQDLNVPRLYKPKFKVKNFSQLYTLLRKGVFDKILSI